MHYFKISGHANHAKHGEDIVCAAVSGAVQMVGAGMVEHLGLSNFNMSAADEYISCSIPNDISELDKQRAYALTNSLLIFLKQLQKQYKNYIKVIESEV